MDIAALRARTRQIVVQGSPNFKYTNPAAIATGVTAWYDIESILPATRIYLPLDSLVLINNSAVNVDLLINTASDSITVPAYSGKPLADRPLWRIGIKNLDTTSPVAIGELLFQLKKLPPDIQVVTNA